MSDGQGLFDKAKDMAGGLKDKVTDALQPDDEGLDDEDQDDEQQQASGQDAGDLMNVADDSGSDDQGGMQL